MLANTNLSSRLFNASCYLAIATAVMAPVSTALTNVLVLLMLLCLVFSGRLLQVLQQAATQWMGKALLLFFAWLLIGMTYADASWAIRLDTLLSWKKLAYLFLLLGMFCDLEWQRKFVRVFVAAMALFASLALVFWLAGMEVREGWPAGIVMTTYTSQSMAFIAASLGALLWLKQDISRHLRYGLWLVLLLLAFNIYFVSEARSGYVAYPFAILFVVGWLYGWKKLPYALAAVSVLLLSVWFGSSTVQHRLEKGLAESNNYQQSEQVTSIGIRRVFAENTWQLIQQQPIWGYGTSSFHSVYSAHVAGKYQDWRGDGAGDPHNQYLFVWLENGVVGLLLLLGLIVACCYQGIKHAPYGVVAAGFLLAIAVSSLFNSHFKTFPEGHLLAFFVGPLLAAGGACCGDRLNDA